MNAEQVHEELARFTQTVVEDDRLYVWFLELKRLPGEARRLELARMVGKMRVAGEDAGVIGATQLLAQPQVFEGVSKAIEELRGV